MILVDNRPGEPTTLPLDIPGGTIADLDGARLRTSSPRSGAARPSASRSRSRSFTRAEAARSCSSPRRADCVRAPAEAGRLGAGWRDPLLDAAGVRAGAVRLVRRDEHGGAARRGRGGAPPQRHPGWTTPQVRSALVSTAGPAWADTARTTEASVLLEGGGIIDIPGADDPKIFTSPSALSFGDLNANRGAVTRPLDARGLRCRRRLGTLDGRGQAAVGEHRASLEAPALVSLAPGGHACCRWRRPRAPRPRRGTTTASSSCAAEPSRGASRTRSSSPARARGHAGRPPPQVPERDDGERPSRVNSYRWPSAPFGYPPSFTGPPMIEDGAERVYLVPHLKRPVVNFGVGVVGSSRNAVIDPWLLGSLDENDVQGETGTPMNVNPLTFDFGLAIGAAGVVFPVAQALLRRGRLDAGSLHGPGAAGPLPAPLLGQRPAAAGRQAAHAAGRGGAADARGQSAGPWRRGRSVLDAHRLPGSRGRRVGVRLELGHRDLRAAERGAEASRAGGTRRSSWRPTSRSRRT